MAIFLICRKSTAIPIRRPAVPRYFKRNDAAMALPLAINPIAHRTRQRWCISRWATHDITYKNGMEGVPRWYLSTMELDVKLNHQIQPDDVINVTSSFWTINFSGMYQTDLQGLSEIQRKQRTGRFNVLSTYHEGLSGEIPENHADQLVALIMR